ncbi:hypothetical protein AgCh_030614 [Apium graveolens]
MRKLDSYLVHDDTEITTTKKNRRRRLVTEREIETALQLIQLKNCHHSFITSDRPQIPEPFMKIVLKSKEFLQVRSLYNGSDNICEGGDENIRKRKRDGTASSSSSLTFDFDDSRYEDANEGVGSVKKMKRFRSIADIYNVTKPL